MAIKIDGVIHQTPYQLKEQRQTWCGLTYDPSQTFKTSDIQCSVCRDVSRQSFRDGWKAYEAKRPLLDAELCECGHTHGLHRDEAGMCDGDMPSDDDYCPCETFRHAAS